MSATARPPAITRDHPLQRPFDRAGLTLDRSTRQSIGPTLDRFGDMNGHLQQRETLVERDIEVDVQTWVVAV
ncbi:MAG: hypothetical protein LC769_10740 [Chloroflexi bacterium]|nr:hypothetical protein [Chloroflexota bacterium]